MTSNSNQYAYYSFPPTPNRTSPAVRNKSSRSSTPQTSQSSEMAPSPAAGKQQSGTPSTPTKLQRKPQQQTPSKPQQSTPSKPQSATPNKPQQATPNKPQQSTPSKPQQSTPKKLGSASKTPQSGAKNVSFVLHGKQDRMRSNRYV